MELAQALALPGLIVIMIAMALWAPLAIDSYGAKHGKDRSVTGRQPGD